MILGLFPLILAMKLRNQNKQQSDTKHLQVLACEHACMFESRCPLKETNLGYESPARQLLMKSLEHSA